MNENKIVVQRIPKCYVGEDCVQIMVPFSDSITIFNSDIRNKGIICHYDCECRIKSINMYLDDERKNKFPYSNIPLHCSKENGEIINYVNQIYEFDKDYFKVVNGFLIHQYLIKDDCDVLLVSDGHYFGYDINYFIDNYIVSTRDQIENFVNSDDVVNSFTEEGIYNFEMKEDNELKKELNKQYNKGNYAFKFNGGALLVIKDDKTDIKFKQMMIVFDSTYKVAFNEIKIRKYSIEEIKYLAQRKIDGAEPNIKLRYNPNIDKKEIRKAKKLIKQLNK